MLAMTLTFPPHVSQVSISMPKTRLSRCAQVRARCRSAGVRRSVGVPTGGSCLIGPNFCLTNSGPFADISPFYGFYWSGTTYDYSQAFEFSFHTGHQLAFDLFQGGYVWAVRPGDMGAVGDTDGDGVADNADNCTLVANPTQLDSDHDGYGNACDADLNNSGLVTAADYNLMRTVIGKAAGFSALAAAADMNGSGTVTSTDFGLLRARLGNAPGPSGLACTLTCP